MTIEKQRSTRSDDVCRLLEACCHARSPRAFVETLIRWCVREYGYDQALALPLYPKLTDDDVERVVRAVAASVGGA